LLEGKHYRWVRRHLPVPFTRPVQLEQLRARPGAVRTQVHSLDAVRAIRGRQGWPKWFNWPHWKGV
jgi:hypothetical protein